MLTQWRIQMDGPSILKVVLKSKNTFGSFHACLFQFLTDSLQEMTPGCVLQEYSPVPGAQSAYLIVRDMAMF